MPLLVKQTNYDILGAFIGASEGNDYLNNIPQLTRNNVVAVGNAILNYQPAKEAFYNAFLTKITMQLFDGINGNNIFKDLKGRTTEGDIEDSYVDYIKGENFDGGETNPFKQSKPDIKVLYHKVDRQLKYATTVSDKQLRKAFLSDSGLTSLISRVVGTLAESAEFDEYTMFKQLLVDTAFKFIMNAEDELVKTSYSLLEGGSKEELVNQFLYEVKKHSMNMTFNSRDYNIMGVLNSSSYDNQNIVIHKDYALDIDMSILANTFNLDKLKLDGKVRIVDNFNSNTSTDLVDIEDYYEGGARIVGVIFDKRGVRFWDSLRQMESLRNPEALYTNYWLHIWQGLSYAYFHNIHYIVEPLALDTGE